jgi:hypothetical protein
VVTCSEACREENDKENIRASVRRRKATRPDFRKDELARYRERVRKDPSRQKRVEAYKRAWYERNAQRLSEERKEARKTMSPSERQQLREYMHQWFAEMRADPEKYAEYLAKSQERRRRERLASLLRLGARLEDNL